MFLYDFPVNEYAAIAMFLAVAIALTYAKADGWIL